MLLGRLVGFACLFPEHIVEVNLEGSGSFSTKSYSTFCAWSGFLFLPPFSQLWKTNTDIKILGWLVSRGRADTCDQIQKKRPFVCISPQWCFLCKGSESVDNLFLHCPFSLQRWRLLRKLMCLGYSKGVV